MTCAEGFTAFKLARKSFKIEVEVRKQINLVHHDNIHRSEHDRVLQGLFFPLRHCEHHGLRVLTDAEIPLDRQDCRRSQ